ncbi:SGNH/GDSL hydrolase family protein [soil metagenome]
MTVMKRPGLGLRPQWALLLFAGLVALIALALAPADDEPGSGRWESAIAAFELEDRDNPPPKGALLFVGSSSIRRWDLQESFPDLETINRGFGGSRIEDSVFYADRLVIPHEPRLIVFYAGDNDIQSGKSPEQVAEDFQSFVGVVREGLPAVKILFLSIKPSLSRWSKIELIREANRLVETICVDDQQLEYVDLDQPMLGPDGMPRAELFVADGLHLSPQGYEVWADVLRPRLEDASK